MNTFFICRFDEEENDIEFLCLLDAAEFWFDSFKCSNYGDCLLLSHPLFLKYEETFAKYFEEIDNGGWVERDLTQEEMLNMYYDFQDTFWKDDPSNKNDSCTIIERYQVDKKVSRF